MYGIDLEKVIIVLPVDQPLIRKLVSDLKREGTSVVIFPSICERLFQEETLEKKDPTKGIFILIDDNFSALTAAKPKFFEEISRLIIIDAHHRRLRST